MPTLSASDYTQFLKFKAASVSSIKPEIQTRANVSTSQSLINATLLASQAAFVVTPRLNTTITVSATVTAAQTDIINAVVGSSGLQYGMTQPHGLVNGETITITGLSASPTLSVTPNRTGPVMVLNASEFVIVVGGATGVGSGTGSITGRVYYTTSAAHGLAVGDTVNVSGISTFTASGASVIAVPSATTFVLSSTTTGTAVTGATGLVTATRVSPVAVSGLSRVIPRQVVQQRANPEALSTVGYAGTSGALSSSRFNRPGGLPTGFKNSQGTYTRLPQNAGWVQGGAGTVSSGPKRF